MNNLFLADIWNKTDAPALGNGVIAIVVTLTIIALVLTVISLAVALWHRFFARRPALDEDLARYNATLELFKRDLAKLPDAEKFAKLADQMAGYATIPQLAALEISFDRQIKDVSGNAHHEWHSVRNDLGSRIVGLEERSEARGERLAAAEAKLESHDRWLRDINVKLDHVVDRTADKVQELLMKWRNGG